MAERAPSLDYFNSHDSGNKHEVTQQKFHDLLEFVAYSANRPETIDRKSEVMLAFESVFAELLKTLHVVEVENIIDHISKRIAKGQHDAVSEFLRSLSKLQHEDFAQEFLKLATTFMAGQDSDDNTDQDVVRLGRAVVKSTDVSIN